MPGIFATLLPTALQSTATRAGTTIRLQLLLLKEFEPDQAAKRVNFNGISFLAYRWKSKPSLIA